MWTDLACTGISNVSTTFTGLGSPLVVVFHMKDAEAREYKTKDNFHGTGTELTSYRAVNWSLGGVVPNDASGSGRLISRRMYTSSTFRVMSMIWRCIRTGQVWQSRVTMGLRDLSVDPGSGFDGRGNGVKVVSELCPPRLMLIVC